MPTVWLFHSLKSLTLPLNVCKFVLISLDQKKGQGFSLFFLIPMCPVPRLAKLETTDLCYNLLVSFASLQCSTIRYTVLHVLTFLAIIYP